MATSLQLLIGKILEDKEFAEALVQDPEKTLADAGIEPTVDLLEALKEVDAESLKNMAAAFGENQAAV
jgi:hypothetical protein